MFTATCSHLLRGLRGFRKTQYFQCSRVLRGCLFTPPPIPPTVAPLAPGSARRATLGAISSAAMGIAITC